MSQQIKLMKDDFFMSEIQKVLDVRHFSASGLHRIYTVTQIFISVTKNNVYREISDGCRFFSIYVTFCWFLI